MGYFDWALKNALDVIEKAKAEGKDTIAMDMDHASYENECTIFKGLDEMGLNVEHGVDRILVRDLQKQLEGVK